MSNNEKRFSGVPRSLILLIALILFPIAGYAEGHERDTWYIGFGLGAGIDAQYKAANGNSVTFDQWFAGADQVSPKTAINFKAGKTLSPNALLGFDATAVSQTGKWAGQDLQLQINNYFLMYTYFPYQEGLFFRLGGGMSNIMQKTGNTSNVVSGWGALGGIGYAFWMGKGFNLTANVDYSMQSYSGGGSTAPNSSQFTIAYIGFDWY